MSDTTKIHPRRARLCNIVEIGVMDDAVSRAYDIVNMLSILINLTVSVLYTFENIRLEHGPLLLSIEAATVAFFAVDYFLRLYTAKCRYPKKSEGTALWAYMTSFSGIVDMLSFVPYYLPIFFPTGAAAFRLFRIMRFFRLLRMNAYYDSFRVISDVIQSKKPQLVSSVFIIGILLVASSLCMYSLEHEAQPDVFTNAFSGIWWAVSTLLTVGYGDIYPVTDMGKLFSIGITCLGVGMVAIPTGIISAGFVDQYSRLKRMSEYAQEADVNFIKVRVSVTDKWNGKKIMELGLPSGMIVAAIQRDGKIIAPRGNTVVQDGDTMVMAAESFGAEVHIDLKEVVLKKQNPWNGLRIRDLDISRQTLIVMIKRNGRAMIPNGDFVLLEGDKVIMYTQMHMSQAQTLEI